MGKKLLITGFIVFGGFFAVIGFQQLGKSFEANINSATNTQNETPSEGAPSDDIYDTSYSFSEDGDSDELPNAWEFILGTDPRSKDSDGDTFNDGQEVKNGYDPNIPGSAKISDNPRYKDNLTIQYLLWSQQKEAGIIVKLDTPKINAFLQEKVDTSLTLPAVGDDSLVIKDDNSSESLLAYFGQLQQVPLPTVTESYFKILEQAVLGNISELDKLTNQLVVIKGQVKSIETPRAAIDVHKKYIGFIDTLITLFSDLYNVGRDPVLFAANLEKGTHLVDILKDIELSSQKVLERVNTP